MSSRTAAWWVFFLLVVWAAVGFIQVAPQLPERIATHFDAAGKPNGWQDREDFLHQYSLLYFSMVFCFLLLFRLMPKIPPSMINAPNRDYWFSPERRGEATEKIRTLILWITDIILWFMIAIFYSIAGANRDQVRMASPWKLLALLLIFMSIWIIAFMRAFRREGKG